MAMRGRGSIPGSVMSAQCRQPLATVAMFLQSCITQALNRAHGPRHPYTLWRNTANIYNEGLFFDNYLKVLT